MKNKEISLSFFGKGGPEVTAIGLGGEGVLRTFGRKAEAEQVIVEAALQGITYFDSARAYAGSEGYYGTIWSRHPEIRSKIFQTSKSASRGKRGLRLILKIPSLPLGWTIWIYGRFMICGPMRISI